ncbi:MAG: phospho-N-acetylmuramoyl-pentapeptide-transferase [Candidatus Omnitrophica bacterium]|nr:phospho-N-acetylmuramoyl-pentapeptide-transferase [Candidatus Omnitrophota bacterium]
MLYHLLYPLRDWWFGFNVFKYITFRTACAGITAFLVCVWCGPSVIRWLARNKVGQQVRKEDSAAFYALHGGKQGTPTMGGLFMLIAIVGTTLLWANLANAYVWIALGTTLVLGAIGFADDALKLRRHHARGLRGRAKLLWQCAAAGVMAYLVTRLRPTDGHLEIPFFKEWSVTLGWLAIPFMICVVVGASNAVNLTDGLDGLASGCLAMVACTYSLMAYLTGHAKFADYLEIYYAPLAGELAVFCAALAGASLGFLWFNTYPAHVFMGDTGSLALGGAIGAVAVLIKKELLLLLVGGIFVAEAVSVMMQVASYRLRNKKLVFRMAPIHHHFQVKGWAEPQVTVRFWIVGAILALLSFATLKVR